MIENLMILQGLTLQMIKLFIRLATISAIGAQLACCHANNNQDASTSNSLQKQITADKGTPADDLIVLAHKAYRYSGDAYFKPKAKTKLVAIEIEIQNGGPWIDLDDFELIDVEKHISLGDFPDIQEIPETPNLVRLIYQVPEETRLVQLDFGGSLLLNEPIQISE